MTGPGHLNRRLVLEAPLETDDGEGGVTRLYDVVTTLWAQVVPLSARGDAGAGGYCGTDHGGRSAIRGAAILDRSFPKARSGEHAVATQWHGCSAPQVVQYLHRRQQRRMVRHRLGNDCQRRTIGTNKNGTGAARNLQVVIGGVNKLDYGIGTAGSWTFNAGVVFAGTASFGGGIVSYGGTSIDSSIIGLVTTAGGAINWNADTRLTRSAAGILRVGTTASNALGGFASQTKAGAFVAGDFPSGSWYVGHDTSGGTVKLYFNNAGTLMAVALA